jgi:hypothetical protein
MLRDALRSVIGEQGGSRNVFLNVIELYTRMCLVRKKITSYSIPKITFRKSL